MILNFFEYKFFVRYLVLLELFESVGVRYFKAPFYNEANFALIEMEIAAEHFTCEKMLKLKFYLKLPVTMQFDIVKENLYFIDLSGEQEDEKTNI